MAAFLFQESESNKMNVKLYVGNLSKFVTRNELISLFDRAGEVVDTYLITNQDSGESKGFAFITMSTRNEAEKAIRMYSSYSLKNQEMIVRKAQQSFHL